MKKEIHKDCPFTKEEVDEFQSMLYLTDSQNNIPAHNTWVEGFNRNECRKVEKHNDAYKEFLIKELESLEQ